MSRVGLYTGSFDPLTLGHVDVIDAASGFLDRLVVGIGVHPAKAPMFTAEERAAMIESVCAVPAKAKGCTLDVLFFEGLAVEAARLVGASLIVRGVRDGTDTDYEMQMGGMNAVLAPEVRTILVPASPGTRSITATLVRQVAGMGGDVSAFVPQAVALAIRGKIGR